MTNDIKKTDENILPDAAGLFYALRSMGYENTAAVADLVDNSIDAEASNIWITIDEDLKRIYIADDGIGMSDEILHTAIRLGGKKAHDRGSDLGKYGLGLITASLSMGRIVRIITKQNGEYNTAVLDYDDIRETNKFNADFHESTNMEIASFVFRTHNADSGTVLIIDKCDKLQYTKSKDLIKAIDDTIGEVFRVYLSEGKHIHINDSEINPYDPLLLAVKGNKKLVDDDIVIDSNSGAKGKMHVLAVQIPDQGTKTNKNLRLNIRGQGFYILRNRREIASALEFADLFRKHNDFNLLRIELSFDPDLDDLMGINLKKHDVAPSQEVINALKKVLDGPIKKVRDDMKSKQRKKDKKNPFITPVNIPQEEGGKAVIVPTKTKGESVEGINIPTEIPLMPSSDKHYEVVFSTFAGGEDGPLFKHTLSGKKVTIYYNIDNEYYSKELFADKDDLRVKGIVDNVIKSSIKTYLELADDVSSLATFVDKLSSSISETE